jgi:hypothetical protein
MTTIDNALDLIVVFAVYGDRTTLLRLESDRIPWVSEAGASPSLPLRSILETHFVPLISSGQPATSEIRDAIRESVNKIQAHLKTEFGICCETRLHFRFEEQKARAVAKIKGRLGVGRDGEAPESFWPGPIPGRIEFKSLTETSLMNAETITVSNFSVSKPEIDLIPGEGFEFVLTSKKPVICRKLTILHEDLELIESGVPIQFQAGSSQTVNFACPRASHFQRLVGNTSRELSLRLNLDGRSKPIILKGVLHHQAVRLEGPPVSLFLDVGSSFTKFMSVELKAEEETTRAPKADLSSRLRDALERAIQGKDECILLDEPVPTQQFTVNYGLSQAPKEILDLYGDEELAAHFAKSIAGLASRFYRSENRLVGDVYWAFPNTKSRDFNAITTQVNRSLEGAVKGRVYLVPEAECLRLQFGRPPARSRDGFEQIDKKSKCCRRTKQGN